MTQMICFSIKLLFSVKMFKEDFVPVLLPMQRALLMIIIKDTLNFMQNITVRQYEFSREKF